MGLKHQCHHARTFIPWIFTELCAQPLLTPRNTMQFKYIVDIFVVFYSILMLAFSLWFTENRLVS